MTDAAEDAATTVEPAPATDTLQFLHFSLERFLTEKALWAANYYVLWPIGLSLVANVEIADGLVLKVHSIDVREWVYPEGERKETIDQDLKANNADHQAFLGCVRERLLEMKPAERKSAMLRLSQAGIATAEQVLAAE